MIEAEKSVVFTYEIPKSLQKTQSGRVFTTVGIRELRPLDEIAAAERCGGNAIRLAFELAFEALTEVNGKPVDRGGGGAEKDWRDMGPKLRNLVLTAYNAEFSVDKDDTDAFLKSRKLSV